MYVTGVLPLSYISMDDTAKLSAHGILDCFVWTRPTIIVKITL